LRTSDEKLLTMRILGEKKRKKKKKKDLGSMRGAEKTASKSSRERNKSQKGSLNSPGRYLSTGLGNNCCDLVNIITG